MAVKRLGLIAGNGKFPFLLAREAKAQGYQVIAAGIQGDTSWTLKFFVDQWALFHVGDLAKMFNYFKAAQATEVIMAGQVNQAHLFDQNLALDSTFQEIFMALKDRKADTIFAAVADKLQKYGIHLLDSTVLLTAYLAPKGTLTRRGPTLKELADMEFGRTLAKDMGGMDIGQTVVVKEKAIVAIEAMEGTDKAILRGGRIARQGAVVVKMSKPQQDVRFDVPVIGPRTIKYMIKTHARCLAIEAERTLIIDRNTCVQLANKSGITIVAI